MIKKILSISILLFTISALQAQQFVNHRGQDIFVSGINMAWMDFAHDLDRFNESQFEATMQDISQAGGNATRWWIHVNGTGTPTFSGDSVSGISQTAINNFATAMDIAAEYGIVVSVCLWSFDMLNTDQNSSAIITRNQNFLNSASLTQTYIDNALIPLVNATRNHPAILCWEIFNEPEGMTPLGGWSHTADVPMTTIQRFVNQCAGAIHRTDTTAKVSCGSWNSIAVSYNTEINYNAQNYYADSNLIAIGGDSDGYLDFYQVHFYPEWSPERESPFHNPYSYYQIDKPLVIGEFSAHGIIRVPGQRFSCETELTPDESYRWLIENGYGGGLSWTYTNHDGHGGLDDVRNVLAYLKETYPELITIRRDSAFNYRPSITQTLPDTACYVSDTGITINNYVNLLNYFSDESPITFEVSSIGIVEANIINDSMLSLLLADTVGYGKVYITATDTSGKRTTSSFHVYNVDSLETNMARNKVVTASSVESDQYDIFYINDGDLNTRWSSEYNDDESFVVDLLTPQTISRVVINWEAAFGLQFDIQVSNDNNNWETVFSTPYSTGGIDNIVFDAVEARYVKFNGRERAKEWGYSIWEFEIYEDNNAANNHPPVYDGRDGSMIIYPDEEAFSKRVDFYYISDEDDDLLQYTLEVIEGEFPEWLNYNESTFYFTGIAPDSSAVGTVTTFKLTAVDGFGESAEFTFTLSVELENSSISEYNNIIISPVPARDYLLITLKENEQIKQIIFANTLGQTVKSYTPEEDNKYDISDLSNGYYIIKIETDNKTLTQPLIIK